MELRKFYASIRAVAKEDIAFQRVDALEKETAKYEETGDVQGLRQASDSLRELDEILRQEYTLEIQGGKWRYPKDRGPNVESARNYYLLVQAKDKSGRVITKRITNEETSITETITIWGERVPQAVYERVRDDKADNEIIDNRVFGAKRRGYVTEQITFDGVNSSRRGQITRW